MRGLYMEGLIFGILRYLHTWKYHRCHGYIINRTFHTQKLLKQNGLVFYWCLLINKTLHGRLERQNFSSRVEKKYFTSERGLVMSSVYHSRYLLSNLKAYAWRTNEVRSRNNVIIAAEGPKGASSNIIRI